jgi:L-fucose isomerase-like protein
LPILVQACPDDLDQFGLERRRDAFCGKISVCNNLRQYGIPYTLTRDHTVAILDRASSVKTWSSFVADLQGRARS